MTSPRRNTLCLALSLSLLAAPARAFLGLALGNQQLLFVEPALSEQDGQLDAYLDAQSPELEFEQFEGAGLGAAYGVSILTAAEGLKARWDRYRLRAGVMPGSVKLGGGPIKLGFGMRAGAELQFLRHFPSGAAATAAAPMSPRVLGSVDGLLGGMHPGDMASAPVNAELLLQAALTTPLAGVPTRPSVFVKLSGSFQLELLRLAGARVRVRFLSLRSRALGAAVKAGFVWDMDIIELLGQEVRFLTELNVFKTSWIRQWGEGVLLDATLDLEDPEARQALELVLYRPVRLVKGHDGLLSAGWALVQELARQDQDLEPEARRVQLHRSGLLGYRQDAWKLKLGNALLQWGRMEISTLLEFEPYRAEDPTVVMASDLSIGKTTLLLRRRGKWYVESRVYATKDDEGLHAGLWTLRYRVKDARFSARDLARLRRRLRFELGPLEVPELPDVPEGQSPAAKAEIELRLGRAALEEIASMDEATLARRWDAWVREADPGDLWELLRLRSRLTFPRRFQRLLRKVLEEPDGSALRALAGLRRAVPAFGDLGPGFLLGLLEPRPDDPRLSVSFRYKSVATGKQQLAVGRVEGDPGEDLKPLMRFLETGIVELQAEAAEVAMREPPRASRARERFAELHP